VDPEVGSSAPGSGGNKQPAGGLQDSGAGAPHSKAPLRDFVEIAIRKTNISDYEIDKTTHLSTTYGYLIEVLDGTGNLISHRKPSDSYLLKHSKPGHLIGTKDNVLQPGEYVIDFYHLSDLFDMSIPGTYTVQVSAYIMNDVESPVVKSNTITITVLPADNPSPAQK